ncbi:MAG: ABC transporter permease, partial [Mesorhizobium sp.]
MSLVSARGPKATVPLARWLARNRGALIAAIVFALSLGVVDWVGAGPLTYFDVSFLSSGGATSAIAAMGQTLVVLSGGFDLSAGAVVSLVNVALASSMDPLAPGANVVLWTLAGIGIGMTVGAFNGFFIAWLRMQPIVVTLSTMFILQGVTLLVMDKPGGFVSPDLGSFYLGDAVPNLVPMPLAVIGVVLLMWLWLKGSRFGTALYAVGSDPDSAAAVGVSVVMVR